MEVAAAIHGAEATVTHQEWMGRPAIVKSRVPKPYRHPTLDARIRAERTRDEANLLVAAKLAGVAVPILYDVDREAGVLTMQTISGEPLRNVLANEATAVSVPRFKALGGMVAKLHAAELTHGDLTTSNIMVPTAGQELVIIDFGLGQITNEDEPRAVDLHLMEEALEATHPDAPTLMAAFLDEYQEQMPASSGVLRRLEAVRERGRYRVAG